METVLFLMLLLLLTFALQAFLSRLSSFVPGLFIPAVMLLSSIVGTFEIAEVDAAINMFSLLAVAAAVNTAIYFVCRNSLMLKSIQDDESTDTGKAE